LARRNIEELRAELRNAVDAVERGEIEADLETVLAERELIWAELEGLLSGEPPL